jgi:hypothetical protein
LRGRSRPWQSKQGHFILKFPTSKRNNLDI